MILLSCLSHAVLLLVVPPVSWLPQVLGRLLEVFLLVGVGRGVVPHLPIVLAVLIDETHLRLAQDGQQIFVLLSAGRPGAGLERRDGRGGGFRLDGVDGASGKNHQLQFDQRVFEVFLGGGALVHSSIRELKRAQEETLVCANHASVGTDLK